MGDEVELNEARPEDEVTGAGFDAATRAYLWCSDRIKPLIPARERTDAPLPWHFLLLTAAAALIADAPFRFLPFLWMDPEWRERYTPARAALGLVEVAWGAAVLALGLVLVDRWAGSWRRTVRWAIGYGLVGWLLYVLLPPPGSWRAAVQLAREGELRSLLPFAGGWGGWWGLGLLVSALATRTFTGFWLARATSLAGDPVRRLAWAGAQLGVILFFVTLPLDAAFVLTHPDPELGRQSWLLWCANGAWQLADSAVAGCLLGLAIALALRAGGAGSPDAASPPPQLADGVVDPDLDDGGSESARAPGGQDEVRGQEGGDPPLLV